MSDRGAVVNNVDTDIIAALAQLEIFDPLPLADVLFDDNTVDGDRLSLKVRRVITASPAISLAKVERILSPSSFRRATSLSSKRPLGIGGIFRLKQLLPPTDAR